MKKIILLVSLFIITLISFSQGGKGTIDYNNSSAKDYLEMEYRVVRMTKTCDGRQYYKTKVYIRNTSSKPIKCNASISYSRPNCWSGCESKHLKTKSEVRFNRKIQPRTRKYAGTLYYCSSSDPDKRPSFSIFTAGFRKK